MTQNSRIAACIMTGLILYLGTSTTVLAQPPTGGSPPDVGFDLKSLTPLDNQMGLNSGSLAYAAEMKVENRETNKIVHATCWVKLEKRVSGAWVEVEPNVGAEDLIAALKTGTLKPSSAANVAPGVHRVSTVTHVFFAAPNGQPDTTQPWSASQVVYHYFNVQ